MSPLLLLVTTFGAEKLLGFGGLSLSCNEKFPFLLLEIVCYPQFQERARDSVILYKAKQ